MHTAFRIATGIAALYHIVLASAGLLAPEDTVEKVIGLAFGLTLEIGPQLGLVVKFVAAYMLAFGVMLLLLCLNPQKYRVLVWPTLVLFGLRSVNRLILFGTLADAGMSTTRNAVGTGLLMLFFAAILILRPKDGRQDNGHASA